MKYDERNQARTSRRWTGRQIGLLVMPPLLAGLLLRIWAFKLFYPITGDSLIYGGIAKNLLLHGRYALNGAGNEIYPTLIRLPGYPFFLALVFRLFGMENYFAAAVLQVALELAGCLLLADFVRHIVPQALSRRAALATLWLACLCPFTAAYCTSPMAETPTLFTIALALWSAGRFVQHPGWRAALLFTFAAVWAALLRPDGALIAVALLPALFWGIPRKLLLCKQTAKIVLVCTLLALTPFALWTARNARVFHVFEPLAPRLAIDPGEDPHLGWEAWIKSWCLDFVSTYNIYWNLPGSPLDISDLPARAFDTPAQAAETTSIFAEYNRNFELTPALDARFARLARERAAAHPWRTYVLLPVGRVADMWLRPRVENLPIDLDWWNSAHHRAETRFSWAFAVLNLAYLLLAVAGLILRPRFWKAMLAYMLLRSLMLLSVQAPEARYTLECFPMLFALGGVALADFCTRPQKALRD